MAIWACRVRGSGALEGRQAGSEGVSAGQHVCQCSCVSMQARYSRLDPNTAS